MIHFFQSNPSTINLDDDELQINSPLPRFNVDSNFTFSLHANHTQGRRYWGGGVWGVSHPQNFKKSGKFGQNKRKFGQNNGKFRHKWQHLWLLVHPIKFGQFYKNSIFGRFNEHIPPPPPKSKWFRDAPDHT